MCLYICYSVTFNYSFFIALAMLYEMHTYLSALFRQVSSRTFSVYIWIFLIFVVFVSFSFVSWSYNLTKTSSHLKPIFSALFLSPLGLQLNISNFNCGQFKNQNPGSTSTQPSWNKCSRRKYRLAPSALTPASNDRAVNRPQHPGLGVPANRGHYIPCRHHPALCVDADNVPEEGGNHPDSRQVSWTDLV